MKGLHLNSKLIAWTLTFQLLLLFNVVINVNVVTKNNMK